MGIFRELTPEENKRVTNILEAQHSIESAAQLSFSDTSIALAAAKAVHIIQSESESPFPGSRQIMPYDFPNPHTIPGAALRAAIGNTLVVDKDQPFENSGALVQSIVGDMYMQGEAQVIVKGIEDPDYAKHLEPRLEGAVDYARRVPTAQADVRAQAQGIYHNMGEADQKEIYAALMGAKLDDRIIDQIDRFSGNEDYRYETNLYTPAILKLDPGKNEKRVTDYLENGTSTGVPAVDQTLKAVHDQIGNKYLHTDPEAHDVHFRRQVTAGARVLTLHQQEVYLTPKDGAAMMLNDIGIQTAAHNELRQGGHKQDREQWQAIAAGHYEDLKPAGAEIITKAMRNPRNIAVRDVVATFDTIKKADENRESTLRLQSQEAARNQMRELAAGGR